MIVISYLNCHDRNPVVLCDYYELVVENEQHIFRCHYLSERKLN